MRPARAAVVGLAGIVLALAGCSGSAEPAPTGAPVATATPPSSGVEMSCDTIMRPSFVEQLKELGWVAQEAPFRIGEHVIDGGIQCVWGDEAGLDSGQMYGWAPIDAESAVEMQDYLETNGWVVSEDDEYVYVSEDPERSYAASPEEVLTYQFAPGWVALADTKSGLALVTWRG